MALNFLLVATSLRTLFEDACTVVLLGVKTGGG